MLLIFALQEEAEAYRQDAAVGVFAWCFWGDPDNSNHRACPHDLTPFAVHL